MKLEDVKFKVSSTWKEDTGKSIEEIIDFSNMKPNMETEIHELDKDNFLLLRKANDAACCITIILEEPELKMIETSIVSEARLIEIYGSFGEYLLTTECQATEIEGLKLNNAFVSIPPTKELTLKFYTKESAIAIYGIQIFLQPNIPITSTFDFANVDEMLKNSKRPISEKAERAKRFLQAYSNVLSKNKTDPQSVLHMLQDEYLRPMDRAGTVSSFASNHVPKENDIKKYIDDSIDKLEKRMTGFVTEKLEEVESKQNQKLDQILQLLSTR